MIDWTLVSTILEDLQKIARPEFDDDEKVCWMLEQTWQLAIQAERKRLAHECSLLPFGDTAASFSVWIKNGGKP